MTQKHIAPTLLLLSIFIWGCIQQSAADTPSQQPVSAPQKLTHRFQDSGQDTSPVELTAADGTGLKLKLYKTSTVIEGPLAFTELRLTFVNPEARVREGRFRITLPEKAAISRFAMRIDDVWQEAEVVEKQAARRAYEDFLHRRQDPALLEKAAGNEFRARIFPIPANGEKELIISYSQELPSVESPFRINLQGLPMIDDFEIGVQSQQGDKVEKLVLKEKNYQPQGDFELVGLTTDRAIYDGQYVVSRVMPSTDSTPDTAEDLLLLVDTSASRALGFENQISLVQDIAKGLDSVKNLTVAAFDQNVAELYRGKPNGFDPSKLKERRALGATDLNKALSWAAKQKHTRLLLLTDGMSTAGSGQLNETLKASTSLERLDVVLVGGIRDRDKMELLVEEALSREGVVLGAELGSKTLTERLQKSVTSGLDVSIAGAEWTWPETLNNIQPGDERLVYAKLADRASDLELKVGEEIISVSPRRIENSPLLSRQAVVAQIARLESLLINTDDPEKQGELSEKIVGLSTKHRVLSEKTALLVLETDADYARFDIDRTALADILVVGKKGLELQNRSEVHVPKVPVSTVAEKEDSKDKLKKMEDVSTTELARDEQIGEGAAPPASAPITSGDSGAGDSSFTPGGMGDDGVVLESRRTSRPAPPPRQDQARNAPERPSPRPARQQVSVAAEAPVVAQEESDEMEPERPEAKVGERPSPLTGELAKIDELLRAGQSKKALRLAREWQSKAPGDVLTLIALGNCLEATGQKAEAARVFGSIIDLFPSRADLRRYAASRLQSLGEEPLELAIDCFEKAVEQRPDHVSSHRFYAFALARSGDYEQAMEALEAGLSRQYPSGRFRSYDRILKDDLGLLAAAWLKQNPKKKKSIYNRLKKYDSKMANTPSMRFILTWETDANDVDFHIYDKNGGHAYYSTPKLESGGELYGDVTTGYGPECFAIDGKPTSYPYDLEIHYYSRGPMGYGMGQLEVLKHDGEGRLSFEERPYVVMTDGAYVNLGRVED